MKMCGGEKRVSRPMERCQAMSHCTPKVEEAMATAAQTTNQGMPSRGWFAPTVSCPARPALSRLEAGVSGLATRSRATCSRATVTVEASDDRVEAVELLAELMVTPQVYGA